MVVSRRRSCFHWARSRSSSRSFEVPPERRPADDETPRDEGNRRAPPWRGRDGSRRVIAGDDPAHVAVVAPLPVSAPARFGERVARGHGWDRRGGLRERSRRRRRDAEHVRDPIGRRLARRPGERRDRRRQHRDVREPARGALREARHHGRHEHGGEVRTNRPERLRRRREDVTDELGERLGMERTPP